MLVLAVAEMGLVSCMGTAYALERICTARPKLMGQGWLECRWVSLTIR